MWLWFGEALFVHGCDVKLDGYGWFVWVILISETKRQWSVWDVKKNPKRVWTYEMEVPQI